MYGAHNSRRIVAQRGVFTIFGKNITPMEAIYDHKRFKRSHFTALKSPPPRYRRSWRRFLAIGFVDSVIYPDLDGLSREDQTSFQI
jgi:hypothetical protein